MRSIVVGTDGSVIAESAVRRAIELATGGDTSVHLVTAYPADVPVYGERLLGTARRERIDLREAAEAVLARAGREFERSAIEVPPPR
jgi:nucleotide-binding universal stress UspA family protein